MSDLVVPDPKFSLVVVPRPAYSLVVRSGGGGGGSGTLTEVDAAAGVVVTNPTGPIVTVGADFGSAHAQVRHGDDSAYTDSRDPLIHTQTLKSSPVSADEIVISDSAASYTNKRATLSSIAGLFTAGVSSFSGRTGAVVPTSGDYTAAQVGLGNVTNDAQLKRAGADFVTFTTKAAPVAADVLLIEDSAAADAKKQTTAGALPVGGDSTGTLSAMTNTVARGLVETSGPTSLAMGAVADLTLLFRSGATLIGRLISAFTSKSTPVSSDELLLGDNAASGALKRATLASLAKALYDPASDLSPEFWWKANNASNTLSSGRYTTLAAAGSDTTTLGSIGTQAPLQGTDSDGNVYVQFDGTAGVITAMQQSGVASTFTFMHDGTTSWTMAILHDSPGGMSSGADEFILDNCGASSANIGFSLRNEDDSGGYHGPFFTSSAASSGQYAHMLNGRQDANSGFVRRKELTIVRYFRGQHRSTISGVTPTYVDIIMVRNGTMTCFSVQNAAYSSSAPSFKLTIGENASSLGSHWNGRLYELMIVKRALSDRQINGLCAYAANTYKVVV